LNIPDNYTIAIDAAIQASGIILDIYNEGFDVVMKIDGSPVTKADLASSKCILEILSKTAIPVMDEESDQVEYDVRKDWKSFWCVDPLDGTKEYVKRNGEFAVNIAYIENGVAVFGIITSPVKQDLIFGGSEMGAFYSTFENSQHPNLWVKLEASEKINDPLVLISSRSHYSGISLDFVNTLKVKHGEITFLQKGSALKFFDIAFNRADIYPRFAPTMEWDIAAGHAIITALGGEILNANTGEPLLYNKEDLTNPHFVVRTKSLINHTKK
jgi:3'(2'), 5'-bisphosphate nucleotidase